MNRNYRYFLQLWAVAALLVLSHHVYSQTSPRTTDIVPNELFKAPFDGKPERIYTSQRDYAPLANELTARCTDNYAKLRAIYEWICDNIDYDLTSSIHRADSCYQMGRGVCQGYCELFYRIAEAAGIKVELISGESKDIDGNISREGHMWLFAYTRENHGILIDPTWGAGLFLDGQYKKNPDKWAWFNVEPEWMLLTHFPEHEHYQLVDRPLSRDEFVALPAVNPLYRTYGINTHQLFLMALDHRLSMPKFYNMGEGIFQIVDFPMTPTLKIGETYTFRVRMNNKREFGIINNPILCSKSEWKNEGKGVYSVSFMPRAIGTVLFTLKDLGVDNRWDKMVEYAIEPPTAADWAKVEQVYPLCVPDATKGGKVDEEGWRRCGIDGHRLLELIREQQVVSLPSVYHDKGQEFDIISVPMNKKLKAGKAYTFSIRPKSGVNWVLVTNRENWFTEWENGKDGIRTMTVTPQSKGVLELYMQMAENEKYWTCMSYEVE